MKREGERERESREGEEDREEQRVNVMNLVTLFVCLTLGSHNVVQYDLQYHSSPTGGRYANILPLSQRTVETTEPLSLTSSIL